jgi:LPS-assembly protein
MSTRRIAITSLMAVGAMARSQVIVPPGVFQGFNSAQQATSPTLAGAPKLPPSSPRGNPPLPSKNGPPPGKDEYAQRFVLKHADHLSQDDRLAELTGHVAFEYKGYRVTCDKAVGDKITEVYVAEGHAVLIGPDATVRGDRIVVDFQHRTFQAFDSESDLRPNLVKGQLRDDLYITGIESHGTEQEAFATDAKLTTCNLDDPHYDIEADEIDVRYEVRAILRRARLQLFDRTIATLPFLVVPLDDRTYNNLPEAGEDPQEGYYVKTHYGIPLKGNKDLLTEFDLMSKLGTGIGGDIRYRDPSYSGSTNVYTIFGNWNEYKISNEHTETFKFGSLSLNNDYSENDYLTGPGETIWNTRGTLTIPQGSRGSTGISLYRTSTSSDLFDSSNMTVGLTDDRQESKNVKTDFSVNYIDSSSQYTGGTSTTNEQADLHFQAQDDVKKATLGLEYLRDIPIGDAAGFLGGANETPVLSVDSDATRLISPKFASYLPFHTELSWGDFATGVPGQGDVSRTNFDFTFQKPDNSKHRLTVNLNGEFKQDLYSDDTAQYTLNFGSDMRYALGKDTGVDLRYSYLRPYGYTPLTQDFTGQTNLLSLDASTRPIPDLLTGLQTGYDITRLEQKETPWQQVGIRSVYTLGQRLAVRSLFTYDPFGGDWSSIQSDLAYKSGKTILAVGSQFDGLRHTWSSLQVSLTSLQIGRTQFSTTLQYNGYTNQFQSQQYSVVYDLHCAEAVFTMTDDNYGFNPGKQYNFFIRLKALPFDSSFGLGRRGQSIGPGNGLAY